jgi:hypothetical protein
MPRRADIAYMTGTGTVTFDGAGTNNLVHANNGALYSVFIDNNSDVAFRKSFDGGLTWTTRTVVFAGTATALAVWYDRWTGLSTDLIHCAYSESVTDDTLYRTIDTGSSDALSTQTSIFAGASTAVGGALSITRSVGGNVYCATMIDAGTEGGFFRLPNANVPNGAWDAARTTVFEAATQDQVILAPNLTAADNQDIIAIYWDASADEISRKLYDDSGNSWGEASIATSMVDNAAANGFPHINIAMDLTNSRILLAAWSAVDGANADLRFWRITDSSISEQTNVVQNGTDDQGLCAISLDTANANRIVVFYTGASDGSDTWSSDTKIYCKGTTDGGSTWSPERKLVDVDSNNEPTQRQIRTLWAIPRTTGRHLYTIAYNNVYTGDGLQYHTISLDILRPSVTFTFGI